MLALTGFSTVPDMTPTPGWQRRATCAGHTHLFYPPTRHHESEGEQHRREQAALALCHQCPVIDDCREWLAGERLQHECIAAGTTPTMRGRRPRMPELFDPAPFVEPTPVRIRNMQSWDDHEFWKPDLDGPERENTRDAIVREHLAETARLATMPLAEALALFEQVS